MHNGGPVSVNLLYVGVYQGRVPVLRTKSCRRSLGYPVRYFRFLAASQQAFQSDRGVERFILIIGPKDGVECTPSGDAHILLSCFEGFKHFGQEGNCSSVNKNLFLVPAAMVKFGRVAMVFTYPSNSREAVVPGVCPVVRSDEDLRVAGLSAACNMQTLEGQIHSREVDGVICGIATQEWIMVVQSYVTDNNGVSGSSNDIGGNPSAPLPIHSPRHLHIFVQWLDPCARCKFKRFACI